MHEYQGDQPYSDEDDLDAMVDPQFGLIDVIEAFTAMRQEWRNQSRETRSMAQSLESSRNDLSLVEQRLQNALTKIQDVAAAATNDDLSRRLADTIAEIDQHVVRVVNATSRAALAGQTRVDAQSLLDELAAQRRHWGFFQRWRYGPGLSQVESLVQRWVQSQGNRADDPSQQGLQMLVDRVQRVMNDQQIQRIDTLGERFDAETMNAIEAVDSSTEPSGTVVEQLAPAYVWRGKLIRYAQVRIAN